VPVGAKRPDTNRAVWFGVLTTWHLPPSVQFPFDAQVSVYFP
jgi:hypothetical protein